jgi:hypothetical protein
MILDLNKASLSMLPILYNKIILISLVLSPSSQTDINPCCKIEFINGHGFNN